MEGKLLPWFKENRTKIANCLFYIALTIELVLMIVEKSEISFSYESYVFRATFLLTLLAVIVMKHNLKEWAVIAVILVIAAYSYVASGKNDMLRLALFVMAARDIDLKKTMKYTFYLCLVGVLAIALLAVTGLVGDVALTADYGRKVGVETRYVFGFGHPNTLFSSVYALLLMWIWTYGKRAGVLPYLVAIASAVMLIFLTDSRTGMLILVVTMALAIVCRFVKKLSQMHWPYILTAVCVGLVGVVLPIIAARAADLVYTHGNPFGNKFWRFERLVNFRVSNLYYGADNYMALLKNWKLFAPRGNESYFDIGWVRLFYWYGIIPTAIIIAVIMLVIYQSMKERDIWALILIVSLTIYTLVEATFVTRYLGRDFFLLIAGVYLGRFFADLFRNKDKKDTKDMKGATNA